MSGMTLLMNPTTLRRVYDNEFRTAGQDDIITVAEVVTTITDAAWRECVDSQGAGHTAASPMVSSFRRNLQREHVQRLQDLALIKDAPSPALRTISTLATQELRRINEMAGQAENANRLARRANTNSLIALVLAVAALIASIIIGSRP